MNLPFKPQSFDIIWAEDSIAAIGFVDALSLFDKYLAKGGCLVIHVTLEGVEEKLMYVKTSDYQLIDYFVLTQNIWISCYFKSLESLVESYSNAVHEEEPMDLNYKTSLEIISAFKKTPGRHQSAYLIMLLE